MTGMVVVKRYVSSIERNVNSILAPGEIKLIKNEIDWMPRTPLHFCWKKVVSTVSKSEVITAVKTIGIIKWESDLMKNSKLL